MKLPGIEILRQTKRSQRSTAVYGSKQLVPGDKKLIGSKPASFYSGNAIVDGRRGWFVGQFFAHELGLQHQRALEIKWGRHSRGEQRARFAYSKVSTTISILVSGSFVVRLRVGGETHEVFMGTPGDFAIYGPGIPHSWEALEECLVISVRFPSINGDQDESTQNPMSYSHTK